MLILAAMYLIIYLLVPRSYYSETDYLLGKAAIERLDSGNIKGNLLIGDSKSQIGLNAHCLHAVNYSLAASGPIEGYYEVRSLLQNKTNHIDTLFISYAVKHLIEPESFYWSSYRNQFINGSYLDSAFHTAMRNNDQNFSLKTSAYTRFYDRMIDKPSISSKIRFAQSFIFGGTLNSIFDNLQKAYRHERINGANQFINGRIIVMSSDTMTFIRQAGKPIGENAPNATPSATNDIYFQKILYISKKFNVKVIFILMPSIQTNISSTLQNKKNYLKTFFGNDFVCDTSVYDDNLFRDNAGHLNDRGVTRFQNFVTKKLYSSKSTSTSQ